jgi:hypothetical protein
VGLRTRLRVADYRNFPEFEKAERSWNDSRSGRNVFGRCAGVLLGAKGMCWGTFRSEGKFWRATPRLDHTERVPVWFIASVKSTKVDLVAATAERDSSAAVF